MLKTVGSAVAIIIIAIFIGYQFDYDLIQSGYHMFRSDINRRNTPKSVESHNYIVLNDFVSKTDEEKLMKMYEEIGIFENSKADFSSKLFLQIGEGYEPSSNGSCHKHGSLLHKKLNKCLFLPRLDAVQHYMKSGGYEGWKQRIPKLTSRISNFIRHEFNAYNRSEFQSLFKSKLFINTVHKICDKDHPYFKPIELNLNIVGPGQGFLAHHDAVYFLDATRHQFPLWLLNVMKQSGLWKDKYLPQVQGVVYIGPNNKTGGEIYIYPNGVDNKVVLIPPTSKSAVLFDGTEIVHGTVVYQPEIQPLPLWQNTYSYLKYDKSDQVWRIYIDDQPTQNVFKWGDVRGSIAYRALCFKDEKEMNEWNEYDINPTDNIQSILTALKNDLVERNRISADKFDNMDRYQLGMFLMSEYVKLPEAELWSERSYIQFNYCIILDILPAWITDSFIMQTVENAFCP